MRFALAVVMLGACSGNTIDSTSDAAPANGDAAPTIDSPPAIDAATALCDRSGLLFCEDFDDLATGPATNATSAAWDVESANGSVAIDTAHVRGAKALKVSTTGNGRARITVGGLAPANNSLWGVAHVWATAFPTAPDYAHYTMVEFAGANGGTLLRPIGGQYAPAQGNSGAGAFWGVGSDGGATGDWTNWKRTVPSQGGDWHCMEWQMNAANGAIDVYIDGVAKPEMSVTKTQHGGNATDFIFPTIDRAWFGWWLYQANPTPAAYDVWFDDIALASDRVGCQ